MRLAWRMKSAATFPNEKRLVSHEENQPSFESLSQVGLPAVAAAATFVAAATAAFVATAAATAISATATAATISAAATTTAIAAATAAAVTATAATTAFTAVATATAAATVAAAATGAGAAGSGFFRLGCVHAERATLMVVAVERLNGGIQLALVAESDKSEPLGLACLTVGDDFYPFDRSVSGEEA